jgi:hypothetical protein
VSSLGLGTPGSPPRATTPTQRLFLPLEPRSLCEDEEGGAELRELLHKIQALPAAHSPLTPAQTPSATSVVFPSSPIHVSEVTVEQPKPVRPRAWTPHAKVSIIL